MKITKKLSACILAIMLIVCSVAFSVSAAEDGREKDVGTDATIAIYPSEDGSVSLENKTFNLYRIFDASVSAGTGTATQANVSYTWNIPSGQTKSPFYDFFFTDWSGSGTVLCDAAGVTDLSSVSKAVDYIAGLNNNANEMSKLADNLKDYIAKVNVDAAIKDDDDILPILPDATTPSTASAAKIEYNGLKYGYYLIVETTGDLGTSGVRSAPILTTAAPDATIYLKATKPSIDKNIVGLNATGKYFDNARANDGFFTPAKGISASAGDVVTYAITFKVPDRSDYRLGYTFSIKDTLPASLELVRGSLEVYESGNLLAGNTTDNKTDNPNANYWIAADGSLEFNFDKTKNEKGELVYPVGNTVTILYEAKLNDDTQRVNTNTATLTYSSDPTDVTQTSTITSSAKVYTYQLVFGKYAANTDGSLTGVILTGAQFELYNLKDDGEIGEIIKFKESTTENGAYTVSTAAENTVTTLEVLEADNAGVGSDPNNIDGGKQGQFKIFGLGSGNYALREIKAPDGYALPHNDFKFKIEDTFGAIEGDQITLVLSFTNPDDNKVKPVCTTANPSTQKMYVRVPNLPGSTLPSTGGMGTFLFLGIGVLLMGACVVYFVIRKKAKGHSSK